MSQVRITVELRGGTTLDYRPGRTPVDADDENGARMAIQQLDEGYQQARRWLLGQCKFPETAP